MQLVITISPTISSVIYGKWLGINETNQYNKLILLGGCLRTCHKLLTKSSRRNTSSSCQFFPWVIGPAVTPSSPQNNKSLKKTIQGIGDDENCLVLHQHSLHLHKKFTFTCWSSLPETVQTWYLKTETLNPSPICKTSKWIIKDNVQA
jgi:hypothetical protein